MKLSNESEARTVRLTGNPAASDRPGCCWVQGCVWTSPSHHHPGPRALTAAGLAIGVQGVAPPAAAVITLLRVDAFMLTTWFVECTVVDPWGEKGQNLLQTGFSQAVRSACHINNRHLFFTVPEVGKSKIIVPEDLIPGDGPFLVCLLSVFSHGKERERASELLSLFFFYKDTHMIPSWGPHTHDLM